MKKILLSALVGLASYTGAYASNEIVSNTVNTVETLNFPIETLKIEAFTENYNLEFSYNCRTTIRVKDKEGLQTEVNLNTNTSNADECIERGLQFASLYEAAGFEITHYNNSFNIE
ncbi:hypothetical protein MG290_14510 (plasmid) [Flavobacterium sp. CBA20B-1]|uniref:hypothetical protein n=1 Tax=unclassified Flavobacterium TaxID=196869 RepID=UPI00222505B2|nr:MULTISPECIES: hypothetical protein [unclassified Flavobacterium]WCM43598.1 hypothetical protein MG290_14510 [Flavobacterium sp. CBA20B-1]